MLLTVLSLLLLAPLATAQTAATAEPDVATTVTQILGTAQHPRLRWSGIADV